MSSITININNSSIYNKREMNESENFINNENLDFNNELNNFFKVEKNKNRESIE